MSRSSRAALRLFILVWRPSMPEQDSDPGRSGPAAARPPATSSAESSSPKSAGQGTPARRVALRRLARELFLGLRRSFVLGHCRSCEVFYLMAKLCLEECGALLGEEELRDLRSWVDAGSVVELDTGCEEACPVVPLYARLAS